MFKKNPLIWILLAAILVAGSALIFQSFPFSVNEQTFGTQDILNNSSATQANSNKLTSSQPSEKLTYDEALKIYASGKLIQFGEDCSANPNYASYKKGTKIMLDNRSSKNRTIYLDRVAYNMKAFEFKIITLSTTAQLPHEIMVDCGAGRNNARILLQQ